MTREEAVEALTRLEISNFRSGKSYLTEAFVMAINALQTEPCEDCISRRAALDTFGLSEKSRKYGGDHSGYDTMMLYEIQDVIEDLPSVHPEPFINKPCVSEQACREDKMKALEKIRAEIEQERSGYPPSADYYKAIMKCLQIIDKYKAESEDKE